MKHMSKILLVLLLLAIKHVDAQHGKYPFDVKITGHGKQSIILIPGFACSGDEWNETRTLFEDNYRCYTLTMAGFAGVAPQAAPSFLNWENAIGDYVKANHIEKPVIVGHSMGGGWALALAADYPDLFSKIVVIDALPCLMAMNDPDFKQKEHMDTLMVNKIVAESANVFYQNAKMAASHLCADTSRVASIVKWSIESDRRTYAMLYSDFSNTDLREKIGNIKCPSLILLESYFKNFKPQIETQYKHLENANLQYADQGLHFIMYDDFDWYKDQLLRFIKS